MDFSAFISRYYGQSTAIKQQDVSRFLQRFSESLGDENIKKALSRKDFLCRVFSLQKANSISRAHYQKIKEYLTNLVEYYGVEAELPTRTEVIESCKNRSYFKDLPSMIDFIDEIGESRLKHYDKKLDLIVLKSIVVLAWYGFSSKEIAEMRKGRLEYGETCKILKPSYPYDQNAYVNISLQAFLILSTLETADEYRGFPSGKMQPFKGDPDRLFRPVREGQDTLDEEHIIQTIKRFNNAIPSSKNISIVFRNIAKNAKFVEIYEDKSDAPLLKKIILHMNCTRLVALSYRDQYCNWEETFYSKR